MALVESLLTAMVRANGDALVMHVGERPYVVAGAGTLDLSTQVLNLDAMTGMLQQLLPSVAQGSLEEFGAVEHRLPLHDDDTFTVVAARGGDDIWIEIRRRRHVVVAAVTAPVEVVAPPVVEEPQTVLETVVTVAPVVDEPLPAVEPVMAERPAVAEAAAIVDAPLPVEAVALTEPSPVAAVPPILEEAPVAVQEVVSLVTEVAPPLEAVTLTDEVPSLVDELPLPAQEPPALVEEPQAVLVDELPALDELSVSEDRQAPPAPATPVPPVALDAPDAPETPEAPDRARVLQMTRTVRIEVPPRATTARGAGLERLLRLAASRGASALFVISDTRPSIRVEGELRPLDGEAPMSRTDVESAMMEIVPEVSREAVGRGESTEWITDFADLGRVRCMTFTDHRGPGVVVRMFATRVATAEQLGLSREVQALATEPQGLVLVAGRPGSGKSTLVSALVDLVNRQRAEYIVTLERQIRLVHDNHIAIVSQREIRGGVDEALTAAHAAMREDPDVLVVDDLASAAMVPLLLQAAAEGLVFVSITAPSTVEAVERFIDLASADMRAGVQASMAESFRGAVAQVLLKKSGGGRVAAREVLLATAAVTRVISDGTPGQLQATLEGGRQHGMVPLIDAVASLVQSGVVDVREAFRKSPDRGLMLAGLKREGIDTSVVERLA